MGQSVGLDGLMSLSTEIFSSTPKIYYFLFGSQHSSQKTMKSLSDAHNLGELCYTKYTVCKLKSAVFFI